MKQAAIFDMDGVIIVNMHIHEEAFYEFGKRHGIEITKEFFHTKVTGSTNEQIMPRIFGEQLTDQEIAKLGNEKEQIYREMYAPFIKPTGGLMEYLEFLKQSNIGMAIASNAPMENIRFIVDALNLDKYFTFILNGTHVSKPKPAPDMFLKCAELLGAKPENSVVFEDAPGGIRAANEAGMKSVALVTSHKKEELLNATLYTNDFKSPEIFKIWNNL